VTARDEDSMRLTATALIFTAVTALGATGCTIISGTPRTAGVCAREAPPPPVCPASREVPRGVPGDADACP
jgi:hypothetical protein